MLTPAQIARSAILGIPADPLKQPSGPGLVDAFVASDASIIASADEVRRQIGLRIDGIEDIAYADAKVYGSTANGLAATTLGQQFQVQVGNELVRYRHDAGPVATEIARLPSATAVSPVVDAAEVEPQRQRYNKAAAMDAHLMSYFDGLNYPSADIIALGYFPVEPGKTYCFRMEHPIGFNVNLPLYCRAANGSYLGIDHTIGATPGMANPPTGVAWTGRRQVVFTIPVGSAIRFVGSMTQPVAHSSIDFAEVIASVQAEEGLTPTPYQHYSSRGHATIRPTALPAPSEASRQKPLSLLRRGDLAWLRSRWSDTQDLVTLINLSSGANATVDTNGTRIVDAAIVDHQTAFEVGTIIATSLDDSAPLRYGGHASSITYIGANHGANVIQQVTLAAHGKTNADIGSEWTDGGGRKWYLIDRVSASVLWFMSENLQPAPAWAFAESFSGTTLTHSSGATNTASINVSTASQAQLTPSLMGQVKGLLLDGETPLTTRGLAACDWLRVIVGYRIANPLSVLNYVRGLLGGSGRPNFVNPTIDWDVERQIVYDYAENQSVSITGGTYFKNDVVLDYLGETQAGALFNAAGELWQYVPRVEPVTGTVKTWDFETTERIDGTFETLRFGPATWADPENPPDRMAQFVKSGGSRQFGFMAGFLPDRSIGVPALRKDLVSEALMVSNLRKQYPKAVTGGAVVPAGNAGDYFEIAAFRSWWNASQMNENVMFNWCRAGRDILVWIDCHGTLSHELIAVPESFRGRTVAVLRKNGPMTLHGSGVIAGGIRVSCDDNYGWMELKIS